MKKLFLFLFVCIFIITNNILKVDAEEITTEDGYARCVYGGTVSENIGNPAVEWSSNVSVVVRIYKDTGGVVRSYGNMLCTKGYTDYGIAISDEFHCQIENYNDIFHNASTELLPYYRHTEWYCNSSIYVKLSNIENPSGGSISLTPKSGYTKLNLYNEYSGATNEPTIFESNDDNDDFVNIRIDAAKEHEQAYRDTLDESAGINRVDVDTAAIKRWAEENGLSGDVSIGDPCQAISGNVSNMLVIAFWIISVASIVLLVVMTAISFVKAIVGSDEEKLKAAFQHLLTRIIVVIILLLLPTILTFVIDVINENAAGEISVGTDGNIFCDIDK